MGVVRYAATNSTATQEMTYTEPASILASAEMFSGWERCECTRRDVDVHRIFFETVDVLCTNKDRLDWRSVSATDLK